MVFSFIFTFTLKKVYILMAWKNKQLKNKAKPCCSLVSSVGQYGFIFLLFLLFYWIFKGGNCSFIFCFAFKWLTSSTSVTSIICGRHLRRKTGSYTNRCKFVNYFSQIGTEKGLFFFRNMHPVKTHVDTLWDTNLPIRHGTFILVHVCFEWKDLSQ